LCNCCCCCWGGEESGGGGGGGKDDEEEFKEGGGKGEDEFFFFSPLGEKSEVIVDAKEDLDLFGADSSESDFDKLLARSLTNSSSLTSSASSVSFQ